MFKLWPLAVIFSVILFVWLSGCGGQVQTDIISDANSAAAVAQAVGRPQDVPCFNSISTMATAAKSVQPPALLTTAEMGLGVQALSQGPCAPIIGSIALTVMRKVPFVGIAVP